MGSALKVKSFCQLDVVYVNYFSYTKIIASILSLCQLAKAARSSICIFVVDNSFSQVPSAQVDQLKSSLDSISRIFSFPIHYLPSYSNLGFGKACNQAVRVGTSPLVLFANCDTSFETADTSGFLDLLDMFSNTKIALVGPRIVDENKFLHSSCFSYDPTSILLKPLRHVRRIGNRFTKRIPHYKYLKNRINRINYENISHSSPTYVDWLSGCCLFTRRSFFEETNGFDPNYFLYFEDVDLARKAKQLGYRVVFFPSLCVMHIGAYESARQKGILRSIIFNQASRHHIYSWLYYCLKWRNDIIHKFFP